MTAEGLRGRADEFLLAAERALEADAWAATFSNARTAAELYGKARLLETTGDHPRKHAIAHALFENKLLPAGATAREMSRFLADHTRGEYDIDAAVTREEAERAVELARMMRDA